MIIYNPQHYPELNVALDAAMKHPDALSAQAAPRKRKATVRVGSGSMNRRFGTVVCNLRKARGLSGPGLAAIAGIGKGHLSKIENHGENVSLETIEKLAAALQVTPAILMTACAAPNDGDQPTR